jgi:hypothetical protein
MIFADSNSYIKMLNIQGLISPNPINSSSFVNYKNINIAPVAGTGNFATKILALDFSK